MYQYQYQYHFHFHFHFDCQNQSQSQSQYQVIFEIRLNITGEIVFKNLLQSMECLKVRNGRFFET
jgi:hypothetical protein